jgi:hypothetical protein
VLSLTPNRSIHDAAADLTDWVHRNHCRLWCNGNLLPPKYITTSLIIVAETEGDDRLRADVVSSTRDTWDPAAYTFELDADEVRARLSPCETSLVSEQPSASELAQSAPSSPLEPSATAPGDAPAVRSRPQYDLACRVLRAIYPPEGKAPPGLTIKQIRRAIDDHLKKENENKNEHERRKTPSEDIIAEAVRDLGRCAD